MNSSMKQYHIHLKGITPLMMHNEQAADQLNPYTKQIKEINSKMKKSDEDHKNLQKIQWESSLYFDDELGLHLPTKCLQACIRQSSKKFKIGKNRMTECLVGMLIDAPIGIPIIGYEGKSIKDLWNTKGKKGNQVHVDTRLGVIGKSKVATTRAIFHQWELIFGIYIDISIFNLEDLKKVLEWGGFGIGLCELRPQKLCGSYGRFEIKEIKKYD